MKPQSPYFSLPSRYPLDLLNIADFEAGVLPVQLLHQQSDQHAPLRVRVNAAHGAVVKGGEEQRGAIGWFQVGGFSEVDPRVGGVFGGGRGENEHLGGFDEFFLDAGGGYVDVGAGFDGGAATGAGYLGGVVRGRGGKGRGLAQPRV